MPLDAVNRSIESSGIPSFGWSVKDQYGSNIPKPIGTMVGGYIIDGDERPDTDLDTGEANTWPDGRPKMVLYLDLQTELREDADDDGKRRVYLRNQGHAAARDALRKSGTKKGFERGGFFAIRLINREAPKKAGMSPKNIFECYYQVPAIGAGPDSMAPPTQPATPLPQQQPPVQYAQPAPPPVNPVGPGSYQGYTAGPPPAAAVQGYADGQPVTPWMPAAPAATPQVAAQAFGPPQAPPQWGQQQAQPEWPQPAAQQPAPAPPGAPAAPQWPPAGAAQQAPVQPDQGAPPQQPPSAWPPPPSEPRQLA